MFGGHLDKRMDRLLGRLLRVHHRPARLEIGFGHVLAKEGAAESALRVWATASQIVEELGGDASEIRTVAEQAQADPQVLTIAWEEDRVMTLEQALTYALQEADKL